MIEICANGLQSAINAQKAGAGRIELCDNLYEGGTTPSAACIILARKYLNIKMHVLIRPRGGDFLYDDLEMEIIREDILFCKANRCDGIVAGFLNADGSVNTARTKELVELARPMSVTFHRAFDMTPDPFEALEQIISSGANRILTSGQKNKAPAGTELIKALVKKAAGRIIIMPGAGINESNIEKMITETGAKEFHLSGMGYLPSQMDYRKEGIFMGGLSQIPEYEIAVSDIKKIRKVSNIYSSQIPKA
ncbi:MAG: copper homeostasis protein CutC [Bacteroidales bacterium]|nr:copper homeostasis protein CutC [Bacteroidales bacterium]